MAEAARDGHRRGWCALADGVRRLPRTLSPLCRPWARLRAGRLIAPLPWVCCAVLLLGWLLTATAVASDRPSPQLDLGSQLTSGGSPRHGWRFEPLGPEGADVAQVCPIGGERWVARTEDGTLHLWNPPDRGFGLGRWESLPLSRLMAPERALRIAAIGDGLLAVLLTDGEVLALELGEPTASAGRGGPSDPASPRVARSDRLSPREAWQRIHFGFPEIGVSADSLPGDHPAIRRTNGAEPSHSGLPHTLGRVAREEAFASVALLPQRAPEAPGVLLVSRRGTFRILGPSLNDSWQARFLAAEASADAGPEGELLTGLSLRSVFLAATPSGTTRVYALTDWEGLFASDDGGHTFRPISAALPKPLGAVAPGDAAGVLFAASGAGFLRSADGGVHWEASLPSSTGPVVCGSFVQLVLAPGIEGILLALTAEGEILRSADAGVSWGALLADCPIEVRMLARGGACILAATSRGVLASEDGGLSWEWRNAGLHRVSVLGIGHSDAGGDVLLIGTDLGLYSSLDLGRSWGPLAGRMPAGDRAPAPFAHGPVGPRDPLVQHRLEQYPEIRRILRAPVCAVASMRLAGQWDWVLIAGDGGAALRIDPGAEQPREQWQALFPGRAVSSVALTGRGEVWGTGLRHDGIWVAVARQEADDWATDEIAIDRPRLEALAAPRLVRVAEHAGSERVWLLAGSLMRLDGASVEDVPIPPGVTALALATTSDGLWLGTDGGLFRLGPGGAWRGAGLSEECIVEIVAHPSGAVFARTPQRLYWRRDHGSAWDEVPLPSGLRVMSTAILPDGRLLIGTTHFGLFAVQIPVPAPPADRLLPVEASPNPFSVSVVLRAPLPPTLQQALETSVGGGLVDAGAGETVERSAPRMPTAGAPGASGNNSATAGEEDALFSSLDLAATAGTDEAELCIFTVHGQVVRRLRGARYVTDPSGRGALQWSWDGRTELGLPAASGMYLVATAVGPQRFAGKIIKLR